MNKYKIKFIVKYTFELDGRSKEDIKEQVDYISHQTKILDMPFVKKRETLNIRKINVKGNK